MLFESPQTSDSLNQSGHSPSTSLIDETFPSTDLLLLFAGYIFAVQTILLPVVFKNRMELALSETLIEVHMKVTAMLTM